MKPEELVRKHPWMKIPVLTGIIWQLLGFFGVGIMSSVIAGIIELISDGGIAIFDYLYIVAAISLMLLFCLIYGKNFKGPIRPGRPLKAFMVMIPEIVYCVFYFIFWSRRALSYELFLGSLSAGICEEILLRAVPISFMIAGFKFKEKRIPLIVFLTAAVFGASHFMNLSSQELSVTVLQVLCAFAVGMLFGAAYMCSGDILPVMFMHFIHDVVNFMNPVTTSEGGAMINVFDASTAFDIVFAVLEIAVAFYFIRKTRRAEIASLWAKKWSCELPAAEG